jgi:phasin
MGWDLEDNVSTNTPNFEVPPDMRALAEKSVAQAREAFDGFIGAARKAAEQAQTTAATAQSSAKDMTQLTMSFAERNIASTFDFAQKLARAKDGAEIMALHAEYVRRQMEALSDQAQEIGRRTASMSPRGDAP